MWANKVDICHSFWTESDGEVMADKYDIYIQQWMDADTPLKVLMKRRGLPLESQLVNLDPFADCSSVPS